VDEVTNSERVSIEGKTGEKEYETNSSMMVWTRPLTSLKVQPKYSARV
jgi:hypothetical protein